jgi:hypothetical protein
VGGVAQHTYGILNLFHGVFCVLNG